MPNLQTREFRTGDFTWMVNTDGLDYPVTGVLDVSTFTPVTHYPDGFFRSGLPVNVYDRDVIRPWTDTAGERLGFLKGDVKTDGVEDVNCAVVVRGNIRVERVPLDGFHQPTTVAQPQFLFWF